MIVPNDVKHMSTLWHSKLHHNFYPRNENLYTQNELNKNVYSRVPHNSSREYKPYIHQEINDKHKVVYTIVYTYTMEYNSATNYWYREQDKWTHI